MIDYNNKYLINEYNILSKLKMYRGKVETKNNLFLSYIHYFNANKV